jgi:hypothetical protein
LASAIDFLDVGGNRLLFFLKPLDALDKRAKLALRKTGLGVHD